VLRKIQEATIADSLLYFFVPLELNDLPIAPGPARSLNLKI
jgi:hypothetical protein